MNEVSGQIFQPVNNSSGAVCFVFYTSKFSLFSLSIEIYDITSATRTMVSHWRFLSRGLGVNKG